jgi:ribosomal protein L28
MSFRCAITNKTTEPGERMNKVVVETREKVYSDSEGTEVARGRETVKEIAVSAEGLRILDQRALNQA